MHVDGSASFVSLFAPGVVSILPQELRLLHGGTIFPLINGHLRTRRKTARNSTTALLLRSVDTQFASDSRIRVQLVYSLAQRQRMKLAVSENPSNYRLGGSRPRSSRPR